MQLSKNFTLAEFTDSPKAKNLKLDNTPTPEALVNLQLLVNNVLQPLRNKLNAPFNVNSGYRSPAVNKAVGGSKTSQHTLGQAADFVVQGMTVKAVCEAIVASGIEFDQLIYEFGSWIHISYAKGKNRKQALSAVYQSGKVVYVPGIVD